MKAPRNEIVHLPPFVRQLDPVLSPFPNEAIEAIETCKRQAITSARAAIFSSSLDQLAHAIDTMFICASVCRSTEALLRDPASCSTAFLVERIQACRAACREAFVACGSVASIEAACRACRTACAEAVKACDRLIATLTAPAEPGPDEQSLPVAAG